MAHENISASFIFPSVSIIGLRIPKITIDSNQNFTFGCIQGSIDNIDDVTYEVVEQMADANSAAWWVEWKDVLIPFCKKAAQELNDYWQSSSETRTADMAIITDQANAVHGEAYMAEAFYSTLNDMNMGAEDKLALRKTPHG